MGWSCPANTQKGNAMTIMQDVARLLGGMREYIRTHGWTQGDLKDEDGEVCLYGSMMFAQGMFEVCNDDLEQMVNENPDMVEASWLLAELIDPDVKKSPYRHLVNHAPTDFLIRWNDDEDRVQQEVEDLIAKAEKIALNDGVDPDAQ